MSYESDYPLFPLGAVLLPGGRLPMQIFEPRYMDLISRCMREDAGFGIIRMTRGSEVASADQAVAPALEEIGVEARIVNWDTLPHNRLKIVVEGHRRFRRHDVHLGPQRLTLSTIEWIEESGVNEPIDSPYLDSLHGLMRRLADHDVLRELGVGAEDVGDAQLGWQLAQYLPFDEALRYQILAENDPLQRLLLVEQAVQILSGERTQNH